MTDVPDVVFGVSADGRKFAEALVADVGGGQALLAIGRREGADLAWAHCAADLSPLGYRPVPGYRKMTGPARRQGEGQADPDVSVLATADDSPELWAAAYAGQWGHRTPEQWPFDLPPGTITLSLRRHGQVVGLCRVDPHEGLIDGPGLVPRFREPDSYRRLLTAALAAVPGPDVALESWGEPAELTAVAQSMGLSTAEYQQGWEFDLHT